MDMPADHFATSTATLQVSQPPHGAGCHGAAGGARLAVVHARALTSLDPIAQSHIWANLRSTRRPNRCTSSAPAPTHHRDASPHKSIRGREAQSRSEPRGVRCNGLFVSRTRRHPAILARTIKHRLTCPTVTRSDSVGDLADVWTMCRSGALDRRQDQRQVADRSAAFGLDVCSGHLPPNRHLVDIARGTGNR